MTDTDDFYVLKTTKHYIANMLNIMKKGYAYNQNQSE